MTLDPQGAQLIELTSYVAQQLQMNIQPAVAHLAYLAQIFRRQATEAELLHALIKSLDVPQLERMLHRQINAVAGKPIDVPGKRITLYKTALPGETQARVAADSLISRYLNWLARNTRRRAVTLAESDRHVVLFIPEGSEFDPNEAWQEFVAFVFSGEELVRTFIAMLNSIQLSSRGFGVPEFPTISEDQQLIVLAWLLYSIQSVEKRLRAQEIKELPDNQNKKFKRYSENFKRRFTSFLRGQEDAAKRIQQYLMELSATRLKPAQRKNLQKKLQEVQSTVELTQEQLLHLESLFNQAEGDPFEFLKQFEDPHRQIFKRARFLMDLFTERAARQINLTGVNFANAMLEIVRLTNWLEAGNSNEIGAARAQKLKLRPLLLRTPQMLLKRSPGDGTGEFCYVCGELLALEDKAQVNRFVFRSPSQRLQSGRSEQRPHMCRHCVALAFVCPLKPSDESVIIRLDFANRNNRGEGLSIAVPSKLELFLRGLTLSQLDLAAGNYLMLASTERVKVGNKKRPLSDVIGAEIYAHLRLADLFDHQTFAGYQARIATGISELKLEPHRLAFLSILIKSLQLHPTEGSDLNRPLAGAARYTLADEPILAIYELVSQPNIDPKCRQEKVRIEIERSLEVWTNMISHENRAKMITDVVAMAGLLYPFVDQTLRELRRKGDSNLDSDREASKLIEEVDEVFNFIYRFADNSTYSTARLYRNPTNWFTYDHTRSLLEKLGIDASEREKTEGTSRFLEVNTNDVEAAYKGFAERDYRADADWRAFTYRLKLALYSRFPGLGVKREKSE
jgi:hypothetical protein